MVPALRYLFLLRLSWWGAATGAEEEPMQVVQATETHTVFLPCTFNHTPALDYLNLTWLGPSGKEVLYVHVKHHHSEATLGKNWQLLIYNISRQDDIWFTCSWNGISGTNKHQLRNRTGHQGNISHPARNMESFSCDAPEPRNWTNASLLWIQHDSTAQQTVLINVTLWCSTPYLLWMCPNRIILVLPSVTFRDAGNYTCHWENQNRHFQLEVTAKSAAWPHFGHQHWKIGITAMGCVIACLSFVFCFLQHQHANHAHRQQTKLKAPARRRCFHGKRNRPHASNGILVLPANNDVNEQADTFSYENVLPDMGRRRTRQLLQKGKILPNSTNIEDDNYENTQEEVKQEGVVFNDVSPYENSEDKMKTGSQNWDSGDPWYANNTQQSIKNLAQDPLAEDCENYENLEEEVPVSFGAARLIAGLRLQLALDPQVDKQDGGSETSTGSQSYEEMNGSLCPTTSKAVLLHPNISNEEDADSYENMESPNNLSSRKEGNMDPCGEGKGCDLYVWM
ncbi:B-lymphocyte antigen CD19 isoform X2 [Rhineura floridana]|uniref:B-lymphocyte antigen CD19 isoform X2 n=1 Tax=Rhineura floridana TaxID=261503 RepID=UPI002AC8668C|nr:B-lymphocyte antigen CD19 isoform X2 [Rhineura floridana]